MRPGPRRPAVNEREVGEVFARLNQVEHRSRNDRQIIAALEDEIRRVEAQVERLQARIYAALAVLSGLGSLGLWVLEVWL